MQELDVKKEKKLADEALAGYLRELVVHPIEEKLCRALDDQTFQLKDELSDEIKKKTAPLSKVGALNEIVNEIREEIEELDQQIERLSSLVSQGMDDSFREIVAYLEKAQSDIGHLLAGTHAAKAESVESFSLLLRHLTGLQSDFRGGREEFAEKNNLIIEAIQSKSLELENIYTAKSADMNATVCEQIGLVVQGQEKLHDTLQEINLGYHRKHTELLILLETQKKTLGEHSQTLSIQQLDRILLRRYVRITTGLIAALLVLGVMVLAYIALNI